MTITGLDHITINVVSLEVSKAFYENVFMLKQDGFIDMGDHTLTYYALPYGVRLELIDYEIKDIPVSVTAAHVGMYRHFCLEVDSLDDLMERCRLNKAVVTSEPAFVERLGRRNMLILDPNGVEIEVFEAVK